MVELFLAPDETALLQEGELVSEAEKQQLAFAEGALDALAMPAANFPPPGLVL
jgi:hypothetical protein